MMMIFTNSDDCWARLEANAHPSGWMVDSYSVHQGDCDVRTNELPIVHGGHSQGRARLHTQQELRPLGKYEMGCFGYNVSDSVF